MRRFFIAAVVSLTACQAITTVPQQPANPKVVNDIVAACTADGVFKNVGGRLVLQSLPYVGMADQIIAIGVDKVCSDPTRYAADASTAIWVLKNIRTVLATRPS